MVKLSKRRVGERIRIFRLNLKKSGESGAENESTFEVSQFKSCIYSTDRGALEL